MKEHDDNHTYREIYDLLTPRREIKASDGLRRRISTSIADHALRRRRASGLRALAMASVAAAAAIAILLVPGDMSASELLSSALDAMRNERSVEIKIDVRTSPCDNFAYIDAKHPFVPHTLQAIHNDTAIIWRADKGARLACGDGTSCRTWLDGSLGWNISGLSGQKVLDYLAIFLSPYNIIESELNNALQADGSGYEVKRKDDEITLTVHAKAHGDFSNPYMLNKSIAESDNIRRYSFDAKTRILKRASVSIIMPDGSETVILNMRSLSFKPLNASKLCEVPSDIPFIDENGAEKTYGFAGCQPAELAKAVLCAFRDWDTEIIYKVIEPAEAEVFYHNKYKGSRVVSIGEAFSSGLNLNIKFVPYRIVLSNGKIQNGNLAIYLHEDGGWQVTGGL